jgi:hypothetical protein
MTIEMRCVVCKHANRRKMIELGWNAGLSAVEISDVLGGTPASATILKHLKEHTDGEGASRTVEVVPVPPSRERVLALQTLQLNEVERRIALAKQRALDMNIARANMTDAEGNPYPEVDWSDFYDILGKDAQAAISSILKTQGLTDKREKAQGDLKLGLFEAMANSGLAPKNLIGGKEPKLLPEPDDD